MNSATVSVKHTEGNKKKHAAVDLEVVYDLSFTPVLSFPRPHYSYMTCLCSLFDVFYLDNGTSFILIPILLHILKYITRF